MKALKEVLSWVMPVVIGVLIALVVRQLWFGIVKVEGDSMAPNLQDTERVMLLKKANITHNTVIVFDAKGVDNNNPTVKEDTKYVKRVIGLPGDKVEYRNNGEVYVNNKHLPQGYISKKQRTVGTLTLTLKKASGVTLGSNQSFTVPKGKYFVLGDNRKVSNDSRYYGFVPKSKVFGVVKVTFWNSKAKLINSYSGLAAN
ncbi:signal peptidase I [Liquorilactobacillus oeni]|uniref:Signal peptidase I n=1 Tax=Liquorilactobacillus oeni DSM 19972 TaxID=1423777 RepID=A0A0R1M869_9LACO|nr:signal peptidase I [Liquorilactobacillus oeni]KRL04384.1 Signal peptidase I [Liquorilactobacillus oeni DSM 19972]